MGERYAVGVINGSRVTLMLSSDVGVAVGSIMGEGVYTDRGVEVCVSATSTTTTGLSGSPPNGVGV